MESIKENLPPKHPSTEDQPPLVEVKPSSDDISWELFNIKVFHNELKFGSSHCLLRHQNDFFFLKKEQRIIMKDINKNYEDSEKTPEYKQGLVDQYRKTFNATKTPFLNLLKKIITDIKQTLITFSRDSIILNFRRYLNQNVVKYWQIVCSDGTRRNKYEFNGDVKLISLHKLCKEDSRKLSTEDRQWYVFGNQTMMDKAVGNQEGIFIEFTEDVIESQNGIFLKLFRDDNPRWKNENDEKLKTILRNLLTSFNDIEMEKKTSQPLETGSVKKGNPKVLRSNKNNKKQDGTKEPDNKGVPPQKSIDESVLPSDLNNNARKTLDGKGSDQKRMWFHRRNKKKSHQPAKENDSLYQEQIAPEPIPLTEYQSCRKNSVIRASQLSLCSQASSTKNKSRNQRKLYYRNHIKEEKKEHDCPPIGEGSTTSKSIKSTKSSRNARVNDKKEDSTAKGITNEPNLVPETE